MRDMVSKSFLYGTRIRWCAVEDCIIKLSLLDVMNAAEKSRDAAPCTVKWSTLEGFSLESFDDEPNPAISIRGLAMLICKHFFPVKEDAVLQIALLKNIFNTPDFVEGASNKLLKEMKKTQLSSIIKNKDVVAEFVEEALGKKPEDQIIVQQQMMATKIKPLSHARQNTELYQMEIQAAGKKADTAFMVMTPDEREQLKIDYERATGYAVFHLCF